MRHLVKKRLRIRERTMLMMRVKMRIHKTSRQTSKQTRQLLRNLPVWNADLVNRSAPSVRSCVIVTLLGEDAFVPFQIAPNIQEDANSIICVSITITNPLLAKRWQQHQIVVDRVQM